MLCSIAAVLLLFILPLFTVFVQSAVVHRCGIGFGGGGRCPQETGHRRHKGEGRPIGIVAVIEGGGQRAEKLWHRKSKIFEEQRLLEKKKKAIIQLQPGIWRFGGHQQQQRRGPIILIKRKYRFKIPDKEVAKRDRKKNSTRKRRPKMSREQRKWRRRSIEGPMNERVALEKRATGQIRTMRKLYPIYGLLRHERQRCRGTKEAERKCGGKKRAKEIKKSRRAEEAQRERESKGKAIRSMEGKEQETERRKTVRRWQTQGTGGKSEQTETRSRKKSSIKRRNIKAKKDITEEEEEKEEKEMKKTIRLWKTERKREQTEIPSRRRSSVKRKEMETENGDESGEEEEVIKTEKKKIIRWNSSETMSKRKSSIKRKDTEIESDTTEEEEEKEIELERKKIARGEREETEIPSRRRSSVKRRETETENGDGSGEEEEEEAKEKRTMVRWHSSEGKSGSSPGRRESSIKRRRGKGSRAVKEKETSEERRKTTSWGKGVDKMREKEREWTRVAEEAEKRQKSIINKLARERMDRDVKEIENEEERQNKETGGSAQKKEWKVTERAKNELMRRESERRETERGTDAEHERFDVGPNVVAKGRPRATWGERLNSAGSYVTDRIGTAGGYLKNIWHRARGISKGDQIIAREHSGEERKNGAGGHQDGSASVEQQKQQKQLHPKHRKSLNRSNIYDGRAINTDRSAKNSIENSMRTLTIKPTTGWKRRKQSERRNKPPEGLPKRKRTRAWKKP
uniref:Uncharacterized protein n=1 Tax=Globodera rostochiensis TaxID=31243 RepID=A0A914HDC2_GLORO